MDSEGLVLLESFQKKRAVHMEAKDYLKIISEDIHRTIVATVDDEGLFHFHENPNTNCPVGRNIHKAMDEKLLKVQQAMEAEMKQITLSDVVEDTRKEILSETA